MKGKHQRHPKMVMPSIGHYHRHEWAIYGTNCSEIETLYQEIKAKLSPEYSTTFVDADHKVEHGESKFQIGKKIFQRSETKEWNMYDDRFFTLDTDLVLVNGNHYPANRQIVIIDPNKKDSLHRRLDQLTQIDVVIIEEDDSGIFDFVRNKMAEETLIINRKDIDPLVSLIKESLASKPQVKALILSGGKSSRMGEDKSQIKYHGVQHELYLADMCNDFGLETYISKSFDNKEELIGNYSIIKDRVIEMGPFGAIISAMMKDPDAAWLVIAVDMPMLDKETIKYLLDHRNSSKYATAYKIAENPFPEPLITIYEPTSYPRILQFMSLGFSCPRKVLINSDIEIIEINDPDKLMNANTMTEKDIAMERLGGGNVSSV